jgi:hypothetical protein
MNKKTRIFGLQEPRICFVCGLAIPHEKVLFRLTDDNQIVEVCPICRKEQVAFLNDFIDMRPDLKKFFRKFRIIYP